MTTAATRSSSAGRSRIATGRTVTPSATALKLFANGEWETVVGVVGDVEGRAGGIASPLYIYRRLAPPSGNTGNVPRTRGYATRVMVVRATDAAAAVPAMRAAVWAVDKNQPIGRVTQVEDLYAGAFAVERFVLQLMSVFGIVAVLLTAAGIFGVLSQLVTRKTREIGVRMALGARSADIMRLVLSRSAVLLVVGTAIGLSGAALLTRFLKALLFGVRPLDPASFSAVTLSAAGDCVLGVLAADAARDGSGSGGSAARRVTAVPSMWQDVRYTVRTLLKHPGFLAVGILVVRARERAQHGDFQRHQRHSLSATAGAFTRGAAVRLHHQPSESESNPGRPAFVPALPRA